MALSLNKLVVSIAADNAQFIQGLGKAETRAKKFGRNVKRTLGGLGRAFKQFGIIAGAAFGAMAVTSIKKAQEFQLEVTKLELGLNNLVGEGDNAVDMLVDLAGALQNATRFSDSQIIASQRVLTTFQLTSDQIATMTPLIADMAESTQIAGGTMQSMETIAIAMGKAITQGIGALSRYGIVVDAATKANFTNMDSGEKFTAIIKALKENFEGMAEAAGSTTVGALAQLGNAWDDVQKKFGKALQEGDSLGSFVRDLTTFLQENADVMIDVATFTLRVILSIKLLFKTIEAIFKAAILAIRVFINDALKAVKGLALALSKVLIAGGVGPFGAAFLAAGLQVAKFAESIEITTDVLDTHGESLRETVVEMESLFEQIGRNVTTSESWSGTVDENTKSLEAAIPVVIETTGALLDLSEATVAADERWTDWMKALQFDSIDILTRVGDTFLQLGDAIVDTFVDALFEGELSFDKFADTVKNIMKQLLSDILSMILRSAIGNAFASALGGSGAGLLGGALGGAGGLGALAGLGSLVPIIGAVIAGAALLFSIFGDDDERGRVRLSGGQGALGKGPGQVVGQSALRELRVSLLAGGLTPADIDVSGVIAFDQALFDLLSTFDEADSIIADVRATLATFGMTMNDQLDANAFAFGSLFAILGDLPDAVGDMTMGLIVNNELWLDGEGALVALAEAMRTFNILQFDIRDAWEQMQQPGTDFLTALEEARVALLEQAEAYRAGLDDLRSINDQTEAFYAMSLQFLAALQNAIESLNDTFLTTIDRIRQMTGDLEGFALIESNVASIVELMRAIESAGTQAEHNELTSQLEDLQTDTTALIEEEWLNLQEQLDMLSLELTTAENPERIIEILSQMDTIANQLLDLIGLGLQFGVFDEEELAAFGAELEAFLIAMLDVATARLEEMQEEVLENVESTQEALDEALNAPFEGEVPEFWRPIVDAGDSMETAADGMGKAADDMQDAAALIGTGAAAGLLNPGT